MKSLDFGLLDSLGTTMANTGNAFLIGCLLVVIAVIVVCKLSELSGK